MEPVVTGILSYGMSGRVFHAPFINSMPQFKLRAVTERTNKKAAERYPGIISYNSVSELLDDPAIELVIVNTPNNTHFEYARQALSAGKHILVEKPFVASVKEAEEIFELGRKMNRYVMVYQNRRWDSDFLAVKKIIESGVLGELNEVHIRFDRYRKAISPKVFKETPVPASGISYDLGAHILDQTISLFGKPLSFTKTTAINRPDSVVDDFASFHLIYPSQLQVFVTANMLVAHPVPSYVLHGINGTFLKERADVQEDQLTAGISPFDSYYGLEPEGKHGILTRVDENGQKETTEITSERGDYKHLFEAVSRQIRFNEPFPIKEEQVLLQLQMLEEGR